MPANSLFVLSFMEELGNFKMSKLIPVDTILGKIIDISSNIDP
jgi:hypothetical protein